MNTQLYNSLKDDRLLLKKQVFVRWVGILIIGIAATCTLQIMIYQRSHQILNQIIRIETFKHTFTATDELLRNSLALSTLKSQHQQWLKRYQRLAPRFNQEALNSLQLLKKNHARHHVGSMLSTANALEKLEQTIIQAVQNNHYEKAKALLDSPNYQQLNAQFAGQLLHLNNALGSLRTTLYNQEQRLFIESILAYSALTLLFFFAWLVIARRQTRVHIKQRLLFEELANHDALTHLPNRLMFERTLDMAINKANRHQRRLALLYIDLDDFKTVNDTHGHDCGDRLLQLVADKMQQQIRAHDLMARIGGDEFVLIIEELKSYDDVLRIIEKVTQPFTQPLAIGKLNLKVNFSIGASCYPDDATSEVWLKKQADLALYEAKARGKNTACLARELALTKKAPRPTSAATVADVDIVES